jgi:hypothetical protein
VYFPNDCFISLVAAIEGEPALEVGMVGREGMLGAQLVLGVGAMPCMRWCRARARHGASQRRHFVTRFPQALPSNKR